MKYQLYICITSKVRDRKQNFQFCPKFKRHTSDTNHWIGIIFTLDLYFLVNSLHMKYQINKCIPSNVRERKQNLIFYKIQEAEFSKIIGPGPNSNLTCVFFYDISIYQIWVKICATVDVIMVGEWISHFFLSSVELLLQKSSDRKQIQIQHVVL